MNFLFDMFIEDRVNIDGPSDEMVVNSDYVLATGQTRGYSFECIDKVLGDIPRLPVFHVLRVNEGKPLRIYSMGASHVSILPADWEKLFAPETKFRAPADVYEDKTYWDIASFIYVPFGVKDSGKWESYSLRNSFTSGNRIANGDLLFTDGPLSSIDQSVTAIHVMPSQILKSFWNWLIRGDLVYSGDEIIGRFGIEPNKENREFVANLMKRLEEVYDTQLTFKDYRRAYPDIWGGG